jgi:hypothetical protein
MTLAKNMKTLLQTLFLLFSLIMGTASAESLLTKQQAIQLGRVILAAPENKEYKDIFWDDQPEFDPKAKLWAYKNGWPRTTGGRFYLFEIREADGFYRLSWLSERKSSGDVRFRIQHSIRTKLTDLMETFQNP